MSEQDSSLDTRDDGTGTDTGDVNADARREEKLLDMKQAAGHTGLAYRSIKFYLALTRKHIKEEGKPRAGDIPLPDELAFGRIPTWYPSTLDRWQANRPGSGYGGGRPRKKPREEPAVEPDNETG